MQKELENFMWIHSKCWKQDMSETISMFFWYIVSIVIPKDF